MHQGPFVARFDRLVPLARGRSVRGILALALGALLLSVPATRTTNAQTPTAADLAARVQARYNTIRDFTADFTQRQTSPLLPKPVLERGDVKVKKPGRMRWTYATGDRNQVVSDGTMIYFYFPSDRYVSPSPMPKGDEASTALLFLAGQGNLTRDFEVSLAADQPAGEWRLLLRPRTKDADFESLTLEVDRATLAFRGLVTVDEQGGTSAFRFTNLRENRGLSDREFEFSVPRGVEVR
jgi:outer membrane lipoprotein carrier protein